MTTTIEITDCRDCPFTKESKGHGECFTYCTHKNSPGAYDSILWGCQDKFTKVPKWCPLKD